MCVLALWVGLDPKVPLAVAANRDEAYDRPSAPPAEIEPGILAGRDLRSGGTWLGVNRDGLFVAVTNRQAPPRTATSVSRGVLALETLRTRKLACAVGLAEKRVRENTFPGFNWIAVQGDEGVALHFDGTIRKVSFGAGAHVISSDRDLDDPEMPEKLLFHRSFGPGLPDLGAIQAYLRSHDGERPVCKHQEHFGTVSSTIYQGGASPRYLFAAGPSCRTRFEPVPGM
jgi:hypothetical protein